MTVQQKILVEQTKGYTPLPFDLTGMTPLRIPRFRRTYIPVMMNDSRIQLGVKILHGNIFARTQIEVECEDATVQKFVQQQCERYWDTSAALTLQSLYWGYTGSEVMYEIDETTGQTVFSHMKYLNPLDLICVTLDGNYVGFKVRRVAGSRAVYVGGAKAFWTVHHREYNFYYGLSVLKSAYPKWFEFIARGGANDIRQLYYRKYAFNGDRVYHPTGTYIDAAGQTRNYEVDARNIAERRLSGGVTILPNTRDENGNRQWEIEDGGAALGAGQSVLEYGDKLKEEMLEGMGIPPEVIQASGTGAFAGRSVPADAFYCSCHVVASDNMQDFDRQCVKPLIYLNKLPSVPYKIKLLGIKPPDIESQGQGDQDGEGNDKRTPGGVKKPKTPSDDNG